MKKLVNWVLPAVLGIVPTLGSDGIVEDPDFVKPGRSYTIKQLYEVGNEVKALVQAYDNLQQPPQVLATKGFTAGTTTVSWEHHDAEHYSHEIVTALLIIDGDVIQHPGQYKRSFKTQHEEGNVSEVAVLEGGVAVSNNYLPKPGEIVQISSAKQWTRPDRNHTKYSEDGVVLYQLITKQNITNAPWRCVCINHDYDFDWRHKHRHDIKTFGGTITTNTTYKILPGSSQEIKVSESTSKTLTSIPGAPLMTNRPDHNITPDLAAGVFIGIKDQKVDTITPLGWTIVG